MYEFSKERSPPADSAGISQDGLSNARASDERFPTQDVVFGPRLPFDPVIKLYQRIKRVFPVPALKLGYTKKEKAFVFWFFWFFLREAQSDKPSSGFLASASQNFGRRGRENG